MYELNTVTYGTASAPYLATKCLELLASECKTASPLASHIIKNDFYVDNMITGSESLSSLIQIRRDVCSILNSAQFELRKFISNDRRVLEDISPEGELHALSFGEHENCKTLGITWNSFKNQIQFAINESQSSVKPTKRNILSLISSLFDLLGRVSSVILTAKILIQSLWELKLNWDDVIPEHLQTVWFKLKNNLYYINLVQIPRHVSIKNAIILSCMAFQTQARRLTVLVFISNQRTPLTT